MSLFEPLLTGKAASAVKFSPMHDDAPGTQLGGAQQTRQHIARIIVAVPAFVLLWLGLHGVVSDYRFISEEQRRSAARTAETVAKVVEVHEGLLSLRTHKSGPKGTIEFTSTFGQIVRVPVFLSPDDKVGTTSRICYDPHDPSNHANCTSFYDGSDRVWATPRRLCSACTFYGCRGGSVGQDSRTWRKSFAISGRRAAKSSASSMRFRSMSIADSRFRAVERNNTRHKENVC